MTERDRDSDKERQRQTERQTEGQTEGQTERDRDRFIIQFIIQLFITESGSWMRLTGSGFNMIKKLFSLSFPTFKDNIFEQKFLYFKI